MLSFIFQLEQKRHLRFPLGECLQHTGLFHSLEAGLMSSHSLADGPGLLRAQVQGNVLLALE